LTKKDIYIKKTVNLKVQKKGKTIFINTFAGKGGEDLKRRRQGFWFLTIL